MPLAIHELPKFVVLEPGGGLRLDLHLESTACEFDVSLQNEKPGRSFIVMIGHRAGTIVQRVRLAGRARILFDPESPGDYSLVLTNPMPEPAVVRLRATPVGKKPKVRPSAGAGRARGRKRARKKSGAGA